MSCSLKSPIYCRSVEKHSLCLLCCK